MEEDDLSIWKDAGSIASRARELGAGMIEEKLGSHLEIHMVVLAMITTGIIHNTMKQSDWRM